MGCSSSVANGTQVGTIDVVDGCGPEKDFERRKLNFLGKAVTVSSVRSEVATIDSDEYYGPDKDLERSEKTSRAHFSESNLREVRSIRSYNSVASTAVLTTPNSTQARGNMELEARVQALQGVVEAQARQIKEMSQVLACVQRDSSRNVSVLQYNILASYLGRNTQPWFLYGASISPEDRKKIFARFYERDERGAPKNTWPAYAEGILTPSQIDEVNRRDADFEWQTRRAKLVEELRTHDADLISLVELDQQDYFEQCLADEWDMAFQKRPRTSSLDGCGVFWRRSKFAFVAKQGFDFVDGSDEKGRMKRDRSCLMVLLTWKIGAPTPLVVVSTHLARDPDDRSQTAIRVRQVTQLMEHLQDFASTHDAQDAPVILCGDLNARHFGEIRGIARTVWQVTGTPLHKFLWCASDVPTGPTSITNARECRIDAVQFLSSQLELLEVRPVPKLPRGEVIPNARHPSDHFPVFVRFRMKESYQKHREVALAWLDCVAGRSKLFPLTELELRVAFTFFDRDSSDFIHRHNLEEACCDLRANLGVDVQKLLLDCFPDRQISYDNFIRAYEARLSHDRIRSVGELEYAFEYLAGGKKDIPLSKLESLFREITPISFSDQELHDMVTRLNMPAGQDKIDVASFCEVVCRSSFPQRDRRRFSKVKMQKGIEDGDGQLPIPMLNEEFEGRKWTKELSIRLNRVCTSNNLDSMPLIRESPRDQGGTHATSGPKLTPRSAREPIPGAVYPIDEDVLPLEHRSCSLPALVTH